MSRTRHEHVTRANTVPWSRQAAKQVGPLQPSYDSPDLPINQGRDSRALMTCLWVAAVATSACLLSSRGEAQISRTATADVPFATTVRVKPGSETVYVSGVVPDSLDDDALAAQDDRSGGTEQQARSVFRKLTMVLAEQKMDLSNVIMMRVYLVAPSGEDRMDYDGFSRA
jgi:enamine deaminase RidA (YjgF/YER057c/UK114 family)